MYLRRNWVESDFSSVRCLRVGFLSGGSSRVGGWLEVIDVGRFGCRAVRMWEMVDYPAAVPELYYLAVVLES